VAGGWESWNAHRTICHLNYEFAVRDQLVVPQEWGGEDHTVKSYLPDVDAVALRTPGEDMQRIATEELQANVVKAGSCQGVHRNAGGGPDRNQGR
jgi:hypothetical protein